MIYFTNYTEDEETNWDDYSRVVEAIRDNIGSRDVVMWGVFGRWDGTHEGGKVGDFDDLIRSLTEDCHYVEIGDDDGTENQDLYIKCSHHDGTNYVNVRSVSLEGNRYYDDYRYGDNDRPLCNIITEIVANRDYSDRIVLKNY